jgi:hypothetical protein
MKVFISHSHSKIDEPLVRKVTTALQKAGLDVWDERMEVFPGDNWAEKIGQALRESEAMVVLFTPNALDSQWVNHDIGYALGEYRFQNRLVTVLAGPPEKLSEDKIPWVLRRMKIFKLGENGKEDHLKQIAQTLLETADA